MIASQDQDTVSLNTLSCSTITLTTGALPAAGTLLLDAHNRAVPVIIDDGRQNGRHDRVIVHGRVHGHLRIALLRDRCAFDELHREPDLAAIADAAIDQAGDVRVLELGEDLAFAQKTSHDFVRIHAALDQLQRHVMARAAAAALRAIHGADAAAAELGKQAIAADLAADRNVELAEDAQWNQARIQQGIGIAIRAQQIQDLDAQFSVGAASTGHESLAFGRRQCERAAQQLLRLRTGRRAHHWLSAAIALRKNTRAMRQSR